MKLRVKLLISVVISFFLSLLFIFGVFSNIQFKLTDGLYGGNEIHPDIVIVAIDDPSLQEIGRWPWDRQVFSDIILKLNEAKVVGIDVAFFEPSNNLSDSLLVSSIAIANNVVLPVEYTSYSVGASGLKGEEILLPIPGIEDGALGLGYINILTDMDGITRSLNLEVEGRYDSFAAEIYKQYTGELFPRSSNRFLINYVGKPFSFPYYSFSEVLDPSFLSSKLAGKLVLIGATAPDLRDEAFVPTSFGRAMPGVEIHANTLNTMLNNDLLKKEGNFAVIFLIFLAGLFGVILKNKLNMIYSSLGGIGVIIVYVFVAIFMFEKGIILDLVFFPLSIIFSQFASVAYMYSSEKKEKAKAIGAFSKYVSPLLVDRLMENPDLLKLGGEKKEITVLFSDIRGFTSLSEKLSPEDLVNMLNKYLTIMTKIVMKDKGLVDKFIGDAIMAFWGAPIDEKRHAVLACEAALEMQNELVELNKMFESNSEPTLEIGIGLNTGQAVVGNMGSEERFDYTAMGDTVNLGSRLEGVTKQYGVKIIISKATKEELDDTFITRELDFVAVKGKKKPIRIFELMGKRDSLSDGQVEEKVTFEQGLKLYREMKFLDAKEYFGLNDFTSKMFLERCNHFIANPPLASWDGVWKLTEK